MSQGSTPIRRSGGGVDVYSGLLVVSFLILAAGIAMLALRNVDHSTVGNDQGSFLKLVK